MSVYANEGHHGGSVYSRRGGDSGSVYAGRGSSGGKSKPQKKHGHGGILGVFERGGADLRDMALHSPGGAYAALNAVTDDMLALENRLGLNKDKRSTRARKEDPRLFGRSRDIGKAVVTTTAKDLRHPLRHPGDTAVDILGAVSLGAGTAARVAATTGKISEGAKAADIAAAALRAPKPGPRVLKIGDTTVRGHYSRSASARGVQKLTDKTLTKGAERSVRVENALHRRAAKWETRNQRTADATARAAGTRVQALGAKLRPDELRALRLVAEETPVERRLGAQEMRKGRAKNRKEQGRHQERIDVTRAAMQHLDADPEGRPVFKPESTKLRKVYEAIEAASTGREQILKNLDLMDDASLQAAKTKAAQVAGGAAYVKPTAARVGKESDALKRARMRVASLERRFDASEVKTDDALPQHLGGRGASPRTERLGGALSVAKDELERLETQAAARVTPTGIVGADDIVASPSAVHIGNPVERTKLRGKPKVSSGGTFGHTGKPSSLKVSTGGSVEHALERSDVTNIVAERHTEAVRLGKIDRVVQKFKGAGDATPRRKDDVWMWTDKVASNERIPDDVRKYLDNPEAIGKLPEHEQKSLMDKIRDATFEKHDWEADADTRATFEERAADGKGVFVPRRLLGEFSKRSYNVSGNPGIKAVDAINNAQKAGLVYLKVNYPIIQAASNTLMNAIQGAANPVHITRAVKLHHAIDAADRAITEDIMGQGAIVQAQFEGQGAIARTTQKIAHIMSSKVDRPARLNAFYYEAIKAGFDTPEKYHALLTDEQHVGDLGEVAQRAREAIVDYGDLSPFERNVVRRIVFVYPWQKGAVKYAGHFLRDHPVQAAAAGALATVGEQRSDEQFGPVPSYLRGLIPIGDNKAVNPAGVNFFQTPAQIGTAAAGFVTDDPAQRGAGLGFLAPAPGVFAGLLSGHDDIGRPLEGNPLAKLRDLTVAQTPAAAVGRAAGGRYSLVQALLGDRMMSKTFPDPNDAYGRFVLGGLYPRRVNRAALNQNAARERTGR